MNTDPGMSSKATIYIHSIDSYVLLFSRSCCFIVKTEFAPAHNELNVLLQTIRAQEIVCKLSETIK
jgi:hypothetical protein